MMMETEILLCTMCNIRNPPGQLTGSQLIIRTVQKMLTKISHCHSLHLKELGTIHTSDTPIPPIQLLLMSDWRVVK